MPHTKYCNPEYINTHIVLGDNVKSYSVETATETATADTHEAYIDGKWQTVGGTCKVINAQCIDKNGTAFNSATNWVAVGRASEPIHLKVNSCTSNPRPYMQQSDS